MSIVTIGYSPQDSKCFLVDTESRPYYVDVIIADAETPTLRYITSFNTMFSFQLFEILLSLRQILFRLGHLLRLVIQYCIAQGQ